MTCARVERLQNITVLRIETARLISRNIFCHSVLCVTMIWTAPWIKCALQVEDDIIWRLALNREHSKQCFPTKRTCQERNRPLSWRMPSVQTVDAQIYSTRASLKCLSNMLQHSRLRRNFFFSPQAVPQLTSSPNEAFATGGVRGYGNTVLPDAGASCLCWLQARGAKQHVKFTAE